MRRFALVVAAAFAVVASAAAEAHAQGTPITNQTRQALNFYGGRSAINTLSQMPRRTPIRPASSGQLQHNGKPFQAVTSGPTVSPYLNLFRNEQTENEVVPSYFSFVRPQMEQQATYQQQQQELQRLQRQVQSNGAGRTVVPGAGTQARYFDTAQFYGGWQR
jgi:thiamine biosynthesis lipoprotein ApbE